MTINQVKPDQYVILRSGAYAEGRVIAAHPDHALVEVRWDGARVGMVDAADLELDARYAQPESSPCS